MTRTLRDVWVEQGYNSATLAVAAGIKSPPTLYEMNKKRRGVSFGTVQDVCRVLGISLDEYAALDRCPHADEYPNERRTK